MHDEDRRQLDRISSLVREVLGANGAYLFGSAVLGGLQPEGERSRHPRRLQAAHDARREETPRQSPPGDLGRSAPPGRWRRVELTIVVASEIRPWRFPPRMDFQYGDWLRAEFERGNVTPWATTTNPDLASLITMVLLADRPVLGPRPSEVFDPVPHDDLVRAIVGDLDALRAELDDDTRNVILTLARIWSTVATGDIRSKDAAADWALDRLPGEHRPVLARARAIYLGDEEERWDDLRSRVRPYADHVVAEIERIRTRSSL